ALCDEQVPYRVLDMEKTARILVCYHDIFEVAPDGAPALWLQRGVSKALTSNDDERARLNRKMFVSLSRESTLGADLFRLNDRELLKLIRGWNDHQTFARFEQFSAEAWSVVEYLGGELAPANRRDRFREFLREKQLKSQPEEVFKHHFGF